MSNITITNSAVVSGNSGDININSNNTNSSDSTDYKKFSELLNKVVIESNIQAERICAAKAKELSDNRDKDKLKQFINTNLSTFTTGIFESFAGGALLEIIKGILL